MVVHVIISDNKGASLPETQKLVRVDVGSAAWHKNGIFICLSLMSCRSASIVVFLLCGQWIVKWARSSLNLMPPMWVLLLWFNKNTLLYDTCSSTRDTWQVWVDKSALQIDILYKTRPQAVRHYRNTVCYYRLSFTISTSLSKSMGFGIKSSARVVFPPMWV